MKMFKFKRTKAWLSRWTWKKLWKLIAPILVALLKDQSEDLLEIAKKETDEAIIAIKDKIDEKLK